MTDVQQKRVYAAEWAVEQVLSSGVEQVEFFGSTLTVPVEMKFSELDHVQRYVDRVLELVRPTFGERRVKVRLGRRDLRKRAYASSGLITMPHRHAAGSWAWREYVVLHELTHALGFSSHGPEFCGALVWLVERVMGPEAAFLLRACLHDNGAVIRPFDREKAA